MVSRNTTFKIDGIREDADTGFISGSVLATKIGVFNYRDSETGEIVRELRAPEHVFEKDSMNSLKSRTWTNNHPPVKVNKRNVKKFATGFLHNDVSIYNNEYLKADFTIQDEQNIEDYKNGKDGVSCGYDCELIKKPGIWKGQHYDAIQTSIRYNHISSVDVPRLKGSRIVTDEADQTFKFDAIEVNEEEGLSPSDNNQGEKTTMIKMKIDNHDVEVSEGAKIAIETRLKADSDKQAQLQKKLDQALKDNETLKGSNEALTSEIETLKKVDVNDLVQQRLTLIQEAKPHVDKETNFDSLSDLEIKKLAISAKYDSIDLTEKSEEAINGMFEVIKALKPEVKGDASDVYNNAKPANKIDGFDWDSDPLAGKENK